MIRSNFSILVAVILGLLLVFAGGMKLLFPASPLQPQHLGWLYSSPTQTALSLYELILGVWLLSTIWPTGAWIASFLTFTCFTISSAYLAWLGQPSCGCLGSIPVRPWHIFLVDLSALSALILVGVPNHSTSDSTSPSSVALAIRALPAMSMIGIAIIAITILIAIWIYGTTERALATFRKDPLILIDPHVAEVAPIEDVLQETRFYLHNQSKHPVRVVGILPHGCRLSIETDLPATVQPGSDLPLILKHYYHAATDGSNYSFPVDVWHDSPTNPVLHLQLMHRVIISSTKGNDTASPE